jgi:hypothetical protein
MMNVKVTGIDLGKTVFHLIGMDEHGYRSQEALVQIAVDEVPGEHTAVPDWHGSKLRVSSCGSPLAGV